MDLRTGAFTTLYDTCDGRPLNSPNDLVFDDQGGFWFTCYGQSDGEVRRLGALYYAKADGSKITRWRSELISPNGVGLSPDGREVYMSDCMVGRLYAFALTAPGVMAPQGALSGGAVGRVVATLPGYQWLDSMAVEANGNVCVATLFNSAITTFHPRTGAYKPGGLQRPRHHQPVLRWRRHARCVGHLRQHRQAVSHALAAPRVAPGVQRLTSRFAFFDARAGAPSTGDTKPAMNASPSTVDSLRMFIPSSEAMGSTGVQRAGTRRRIRPPDWCSSSR